MKPNYRKFFGILTAISMLVSGVLLFIDMDAATYVLILAVFNRIVALESK